MSQVGLTLPGGTRRNIEKENVDRSLEVRLALLFDVFVIVFSQKCAVVVLSLPSVGAQNTLLQERNSFGGVATILDAEDADVAAAVSNDVGTKNIEATTADNTVATPAVTCAFQW